MVCDTPRPAEPDIDRDELKRLYSNYVSCLEVAN